MQPARILSLTLALTACGGGASGPVPPSPPPPPSGGPDLLVSLSGPGDRATGASAMYTVQTRNIGGAPADDVTVTVELASGLSVPSISDGGSYDAGAIAWPAGAIAAGANVTHTFSVDTPPIGPLSATASATTTSEDANPRNNDGSAANASVVTIVSFDPVMTITGESAGDQFGWLIEGLGDIDDDGVDDFTVSAPTSSAGGASSGRVYVYSGASGDELHRFTGDAGERLGDALDLAGDVDDDGTPDIVAGAPSGGAGAAYVYSGATGATLHALSGESAGDQFGDGVGRLGDIDGDGADDFLVAASNVDGATNGGGRVYVFSGRTGAVLYSVDGDRANGQFGSAVGGVGDLTGDGVPDFAVGAPGGGGRVYAFSGSDGAALWTFDSDATGSVLGQFWINSPGDLDGDGVPEVYVSDIQNSGAAAFAGRAYALSGADGSVLHTFDGNEAGEGFGIGRGIPDVTGDGVGDLFLAAWLADEGGQDAGKAYLFSGADGSLVRTFTSTTAGENMGFDAVAIGDLDGDGARDFLISAIAPNSPGTVYVVGGLP
ncbi:MAG: hypothetical protein R3195_17865 [Gemmatimonadota bacterium]|nr:hypothetical protein [Gemmatimonadota bacterium]